jgi:HTH-type transcriptional regulator/antitoxin HigA
MSAHNVAQAFDTRRYGQLLADIRPAVIETEEENERLLAEIERLMIKDEEEGLMHHEEVKLLDLITVLVEQFEEKHDSRLRHLMEARGRRQADLCAVLGSRGVTSDIVNGRRPIGLKVARALGEFFGVSPELFLVTERQKAGPDAQ